MHYLAQVLSFRCQSHVLHVLNVTNVCISSDVYVRTVKVL